MAEKTKNNGMGLRIVVLMCLGISANGEACFPCGCKTQQRHTTLATTVGFNPIQGTGADAGYWLTFETCFEALRVGTELSVGGMCGGRRRRRSRRRAALIMH